ncbi:MAG: ATP-binding cassette domain-containing protein [Alphaproteobacteria bacterium]|nr:ATP-binding cassette domain-containing protein [Alphaproteobacteria bacterium]
MLSVRNLSFSYENGKKVFDGVDLDIMPSEITVLIGPSGTGKTTLLRCLALLDPPQKGTIKVDDQTFLFPAPPQGNPAPPWPKLTAVFQQLFLWPHLTLRENILLPVRLRNLAENGVELDKLIEAFDMQEFIDHYPNEASLGQRQRVALARSLMLKPRYLLLDEITSALDVEQIAKILSYLKTLRGQDLGIFIITHLLGFARHTADQVLFMADGKIEERGGPEILKDPKSERLYQFLSVIAAAS